jgi:hypothetical protein
VFGGSRFGVIAALTVPSPVLDVCPAETDTVRGSAFVTFGTVARVTAVDDPKCPCHQGGPHQSFGFR